MKVLIISCESWREDNNAGNVNTNLFENSDFEFANIYCSPGEPFNNLCKKYYQMTDRMMIDNIFRRKEIGEERYYNEWPKEISGKKDIKASSRFYKFFRRYNFSFFYLLRTIIWQLGKWNNKGFKEFIKSFEPDIIYAPCYGTKEMIDVVIAAKNVVNVPVVSYVWDDVYSLKQISFAPSYWIRRLLFRHTLKINQNIFDLMYTMTDEQKEELENELDIKLRVLKKGGNFDDACSRKVINNPVRIIYAGNLLYGRFDTLKKIVQALKKINKNEVKAKLYIYSGDVLLKKHYKYLHDGRSSEIKGCVSYDELKKIYKKMDVAIHVESFELKYRYLTRLSFSTKIIDCLESGCAILAIAWKKQAGYQYIKKNDIGICINDVADIKAILENMISDREVIEKYSACAIEYGRENHDARINRERFWDDLRSLIRK